LYNHESIFRKRKFVTYKIIKHALEIATILQKYGDVYLISESDFSIEELEKYFKISLKNCKKIIEANINELFTKNFDIFINSTYNSSLISKALKSYYIVSFPHRNVTENFLRSYKFLHNSDFTKKWASEWWGKHENEILYPLGGFEYKPFENFKKEKIILSVGRFFVDGHSKNQLEIAKIFSKVVKNNIFLKDWKLVLIGGVDFNNNKNIEYLNKIKKILKNTNYELITNAKFSVLEKFYKQAYIYIHATGLNRNIYREPERLEHFGIS
jgi:PHD/YefM family antitoxin component YafN of YafNO toxin-antitoxin module